MYYYEVTPRLVIRSDQASFTYSSVDKLLIGQIVVIEIGSKKSVGVVVKEVKKPSFVTKSIAKVIDDLPLPVALLSLANWMSEYYQTHLGLVLQTILPRGIEKSRRQVSDQPKTIFKRNESVVKLTTEQSNAIKNIEDKYEGSFLLQGVTGSGKTEIYIRLAQKAAESGRSTVILVPEIALTPQLVSQFSSRFKNLVVTHSEMTESDRHSAWLKALRAKEPMIVIGPRSALFTPLNNLGLIIIDEAHEPSFKQEKSPRYSALRVASMLGRFHKAKVVFGSATPSVTDRYLADSIKGAVIRLSSPAQKTQEPKLELIDMSKRKDSSDRHPFLSKKLLAQIEASLDNKKQVLIFHNRRGSAQITLCKGCGWIGECPQCNLPLTLHSDSHKLLCHICNYSASVPTSCPVCSNANIIHKGVGTKLVQTELKKLFPKANIRRFDADNKSSDKLSNSYAEVYSGDVDIIIGTQIIAKGLDLPHLETVGIIQADSGLSLPDYTSEERVFQLLAQVVGRVGRFDQPTNVIVQSYRLDHPSVIYGINQNYDSMYEYLIKERKKSDFPPFSHILKLTCNYKTEAAAIKNSKLLLKELLSLVSSDTKVLGPAPAFYEYRNGMYRWQLVLKSPKRSALVEIIKHVPPRGWQVELDPISLL